MAGSSSNMDENKMVEAILNAYLESTSHFFPVSPAQSALTWDSGTRLDRARNGPQESGPESVSKEQWRQARSQRPDLASLLRSRGAVPMTPAPDLHPSWTYTIQSLV